MTDETKSVPAQSTASPASDTELLPCPFCGSPAHKGSGFSPLESVTYAYCSNNNCALHDVDLGFTPGTWNMRDSSAQSTDAMKVKEALLRAKADLEAARDYIGHREGTPYGILQTLQKIDAVLAAPSPAALDPVTVEACAKHIEQTYRDEPDEVLRATFIVPEAKSGILQAWHQASDVAAAIRALLSQPDPSGNAPEPVVYISEEGIENTRIFRAQGVVVYPQPVDSCKIPLYRGAPASGNVQEAVSSTKRPDPVVHDERFPSERSVTHTDETKP